MIQRRIPLLASTVIIILIIAPYIFAVSMNSDGNLFGGFLINPVDGHSYLAKMQQGFRGEWRFELPYTAEAGSGAYLFLFYLFLGHLCRILGLPLILVFHSFRILGAVMLLGVLYLLNSRIFVNERYRNIGFMVSAFGSGLGWIAVFAGMFTSDFWVAEAYPFLSMYANPHFSIGLALMILALLPDRKTSIMADLALGISLSIMQPFAVVIVITVRAGCLLFEMFGKDSPFRSIINAEDFIPTAAFVFGGGTVLIYQYWSILTDPVLSLWNAQNITDSPNLVDLAISFSPTLIIAAVGISAAWREESGRKLVIWAVVSLTLVLIPWNLQRRFLTGIYVPLAGLSIYGLIELERNKRLSYRKGVIALLVCIIPTNIIVVSSGIQAAAKQDPQIYQEEKIIAGLNWIDENTAEDALILADEEVGLLIPSRTGRNVIYGHPFETVNAEQEKDFLKEFFEIDQEDIFFAHNLSEKEIDYLFLKGEGSVNLEKWISERGFDLGYENDMVRIYWVGKQ